MNIALLVPMWGRHDAAKLCFKSIDRTKSFCLQMGIAISEYVIVSNEEDEKFAHQNYMNTIYAPNDQGLGFKFNVGLNHILKCQDFHYLCVLGSDDVISTTAILWYLPYFSEGVPFFGITNPAFYNLETGEAVYYKYKIQSGAFRMHRVEELRRATWNPSKNKYALWPDHIGFGMDIESENILLRAGYAILDVTPKIGTPLILDIKDEGSLSSWKNLVDSGHARIDRRDLYKWFPEIEEIEENKRLKKSFMPSWFPGKDLPEIQELEQTKNLKALSDQSATEAQEVYKAIEQAGENIKEQLITSDDLSRILKQIK